MTFSPSDFPREEPKKFKVYYKWAYRYKDDFLLEESDRYCENENDFLRLCGERPIFYKRLDYTKLEMEG